MPSLEERLTQLRVQRLEQELAEATRPWWRKAISRVGLPLAIGGGVLAAGALAERTRAVPRPRIMAELERRMDRPLSEDEGELAEAGYAMLKTYAPSMLRHPVVSANYLRRIIQARELDPSMVQQLVDVERRFRQPDKPGAGALGLIGGLGSVLGEIV